MEKPLISIIIPAFNSEKIIKRCLDSIQSQTIPRKNFEIIVVDDGSTDNTVKIAKESCVDLVIDTGVNRGIGPARNTGVKEAKGKYYAFIDSDCEAKRNWLEIIQKELEHNDAIAGALLNGNNTIISWSEYLFEFSNFNPNMKRSSIKFSSGANHAYKKNIFLSISGFDVNNDFSEDVLRGNALTKSGIIITFVPEMQVYHYGRTTLNKFLDNVERFGTRCYKDRKIYQSTYTKLTRKKWYIPFVFIFKFGARLKSAYKIKKLSIFFICLPIILLGNLYFCKGVLKGFSLK